MKKVLSVFMTVVLISCSALFVSAEEGVVTIVPDFSTASFQISAHDGSSGLQLPVDSSLGTPGGVYLTSRYLLPSGSTYLRYITVGITDLEHPFVAHPTSGVVYSLSFDYEWNGVTLSGQYNGNDPSVRLFIGSNSNYTYGALYPLSGGSYELTGGHVSFEFAISEKMLSYFDDFSYFRVMVYPDRPSVSDSLIAFRVKNFKITYTPTTQSVIDQIAQQGNLITGAINTQTGEITGEINKQTDQIIGALDGYMNDYDSPRPGMQDKVDGEQAKYDSAVDNALGGKSDEEIQAEVEAVANYDWGSLDQASVSGVKGFMDNLLSVFGADYMSLLLFSCTMGVAIYVIGRRRGT